MVVQAGNLKRIWLGVVSLAVVAGLLVAGSKLISENKEDVVDVRKGVNLQGNKGTVNIEKIQIGNDSGTETNRNDNRDVTTKKMEERKFEKKIGVIKVKIEQIRKKNKIRELRGLEESAPISTLPKGVFGFTSNSAISIYVLAKNYSRDHDFRLHKKKGNFYNVEIHKTPKGEIQLIAYVSEENLMRLQNSVRDSHAEMFIFFEEKKEYRFPVGISLSRISNFDSRYGEELGIFAWIKVK